MRHKVNGKTVVEATSAEAAKQQNLEERDGPGSQSLVAETDPPPAAVGQAIRRFERGRNHEAVSQ